MFYDIRGLTPFTEYEFVVLAVNNVGRGDNSKPVVATTGETGTRGQRRIEQYWSSSLTVVSHEEDRALQFWYVYLKGSSEVPGFPWKNNWFRVKYDEEKT